ncbi:MAG: putative zinc-binding metallopeptidase [Pseudobdellovibrio sp.]
MLKTIILLSLLLSTAAHAETIYRSVFCAGGTPALGSDKIIEKLKKQKITFTGSKPQWALLKYISNVAEEFKITGPMTFFFKSTPGSVKLTRTDTSSGPVIFVTSDAEEKLFGPLLEKYREEACSAKAPKGDIEFFISFSNTVYEQLLRAVANKEQVSAHITKKTGWSILDTSNKIERPFRLEELITIAKQIIDLPPNVFKQMKIKKIGRHQFGVDLPITTASAIYYADQEKILFGDKAFIGQTGADLYGEGTIIHEMGHAYWRDQSETFKQSYIDISWKKSSGGGYVLKNPNSTSFVSTYAMSKPEEDFAEHFSAFVNQPEWLVNKAPQKHTFLKNLIFPDIDYFTTAAENAKIYIDSENPDTKPPWITRNIQWHFSQKASLEEVKNGKYPLNVRIDEAHDDISGLDDLDVTFESIKDSNISFSVKLKPIGPDFLNTALEGQTTIDTEEVLDGMYRVRSISLNDRAKNYSNLETSGIPNLYLKGSLIVNKRTKPTLDQSSIKVKSQPTIDGHNGIELIIPVKHTADLNMINLDWDLTSMNHPVGHRCFSRNYEGNCFLSEVGDSEVRIRSYFWKQYPTGQVNLTNLTLNYAATKSYIAENFKFPINKQIGFEHFSGVIKTNLIELDVNSMKLSVEKGDNDKGGDTSIKFDLPITMNSLDHDDFYIYVTVRGPSGKSLGHSVSKNDSKVVNGKLSFKFPLYTNQEKGEYIVESFSVSTDFKAPRSLAFVLDNGAAASVQIKLSERGIKKSFKILDDQTIRLD